MECDRKVKAPDTANIRGSKASNVNNLNTDYSSKQAVNSPSLSENLQNFRQAIIDDIGHAPDTIETAGELERFSSNGKKSDLSGWYVFYLDRDFAAGAYGCWRKGHKHTWNNRTGSGQLPKAEWKRINAAITAGRRKAAAERKLKAEQAHQKAVSMWQSAEAPNPQHPYLINKKVGAYGIRQLGELLLVPLCDPGGILHSLQTITPDGEKRFLSGTPKQGKFCLIGESLTDPGGVFLCEGYATGASLYETYHRPVLVAFDSGNLLPVASVYRDHFPHISITVCADNDRKTEGNPGLTKARQVCKTVSGIDLMKPEFPESAPLNLSDFNDLIALLGSSAHKEHSL